MAARKNNACGVGIALTYDSKAVIGSRITITDEATALTYGYDKVGVYSCSWGPRDNGQTMNAPNYLVRKAFSEGINNGRQGKGSIYVSQAAMAEGMKTNPILIDTRFIYSVTVGAVNHTRRHPTYSEACAANIVAYSSGSGKYIVCYLSPSIGFLCTPDRFVIDYYGSGKICALIHMEELLLLHPMQSVLLLLLWKHG